MMYIWKVGVVDTTHMNNMICNLQGNKCVAINATAPGDLKISNRISWKFVCRKEINKTAKYFWRDAHEWRKCILIKYFGASSRELIHQCDKQGYPKNLACHFTFWNRSISTEREREGMINRILKFKLWPLASSVKREQT